jgi:hypothetical protein
MIQSLEIQGYRCFDRFEMSGLKRVNLLVGKNGGGKTSVLEALFILRSGDRSEAVKNVMRWRGEWSGDVGVPTEHQFRQDMGHLFPSHESQLNAKFTVIAKTLSSQEGVSVGWKTLLPGEPQILFGYNFPRSIDLIAIEAMGDTAPRTFTMYLGSNTSIPPIGNPSGKTLHCKFISPYSVDTAELITWWNGVALTPDEPFVLESLRVLNQKIERIASLPEGPGRASFKVKLSDQDQPVPLGSLGNGIARMLAIAIAITQCKGGVLLIDEVDSGLHYTVMGDMWKLIAQTAQKLDVQVFATTHNSDCIRSLAGIADNGLVSIQRIEVGRPAAISYSENQVRVAAEHNIEVR